MPERVIFAWRRFTPPLFLGGAEISVRVLSGRLAASGYEVFCIGSYVDPRSGISNLDAAYTWLTHSGIPCFLDVSEGSLRYEYHGVTCMMMRPEDLRRTLEDQLQRPATVVGAQEGADEIIACAQACGARTVGWLHSPSPIGLAVLKGKPTHILATSRFVAERAFESCGREAIVFFPPFDDAPLTDISHRDAITLVNPIPDKGVELFLSLSRRFSERKFLAVEGWHPVQLPQKDLRSNLRYWPRQLDMEPVFAETRLLLVPSRIDEGFGRVVVEAGLHRIPALVSGRAGLVEAAGAGPAVIEDLDIDAWSTAIRTLDDKDAYLQRCQAARENAIKFLRDPVSVLISAGVLAPA